jgi:hypothetical protein
LAIGPAISTATPISPSLNPSINPSAPAEARRVTVKKLGSTDVVISCPESLQKLAKATLITPRVRQPARSPLSGASLGLRCSELTARRH